MPLPPSGQLIIAVLYTGIAWGRLPVAMQNELVTFGFTKVKLFFLCRASYNRAPVQRLNYLESRFHFTAIHQ